MASICIKLQHGAMSDTLVAFAPKLGGPYAHFKHDSLRAMSNAQACLENGSYNFTISAAGSGVSDSK